MTVTTAQREVLQLSAYGFTNQDIAEKRGTSINTVREQVMIVRQRLGADNITHAVAIAIRNGLIE